MLGNPRTKHRSIEEILREMGEKSIKLKVEIYGKHNHEIRLGEFNTHKT